MDNDNEVKINDDNNTNAKNEILLKYLDSLLEQIFLDENSTKFNRRLERFVVKQLKKRQLPTPPYLD